MISSVSSYIKSVQSAIIMQKQQLQNFLRYHRNAQKRKYFFLTTDLCSKILLNFCYMTVAALRIFFLLCRYFKLLR